MASDGSSKGQKRSKAFYRKSTYGAKRQCTGKNILEPGIRGFLVMCHSNESSAVRESYNILNEYADLLYGPEKRTTEHNKASEQGSESEEDEDIEKALKKEVEGLKNIAPIEKRFQNVATKAKNIVFIRTTLEDTVKVVTTVMEDIASRKLNRARYAARMLPIVGTCKAQTAAIAELAKNSLSAYFSEENPDVPASFTIMFKARNNNATTCGKESVIPVIKHEILTINPKLTFAWSDFDVAVLVEIVCTNCCLSLAPGYTRLRKYNFQELANGPRTEPAKKDGGTGQSDAQEVSNKAVCGTKVKNASEEDSGVHEEAEERNIPGVMEYRQTEDEDKALESAEKNEVSTLKSAETESEANLVLSDKSQSDASLDLSTSVGYQSCLDDKTTEFDKSNTDLANECHNFDGKGAHVEVVEKVVKQTSESSEVPSNLSQSENS